MTLSKCVQTKSLDQFNLMNSDKWAKHFSTVIEKSPELAQKTWREQAYCNFEELEKAFFDALDSLNLRDQIKIINRHRNSMQTVIQRFIKFKADINSGALIKFVDISQFESQLYQGIWLLKSYEQHFGFPFVMKPTDINFEDFYMALKLRCNNTLEQEVKTAIEEIKKFASEKLHSAVNSSAQHSIFKS